MKARALGPHRQHLLARRQDRRADRRHRLLHLEGRAHLAHLLARARAGGVRRHGERHLARLRAHADGHRAAHRGAAPGAARADPGRALLRAGGVRARGALPRLAAVGLHHRRDRRPERRRASWTERSTSTRNSSTSKGKTAFIPGGYGGIGEAIAAGLARGRREGGGRRAQRDEGRSARRALREDAATARTASRWTSQDVTSARSVDAVAASIGAARHPGELRRHQARAGARRGHRGGLRRGLPHQPQVGDVPRAGGGEAPDRRRGAAASRCTCSRCARSSACAAAATRPTARPRAAW